MKNQIITISLITIALAGFSQNKKEQIEQLNLSIDSCKTVIIKQLSDLDSKQIKITELEQKILIEQKNTKEKSAKIIELEKEIASLKNKIPAEANFKLKVISKVENQDERFGTDSEIELYLIIENQKIDTYLEFGEPDLNSEKTYVQLNSEMSEKSYEIVSISTTKVLVKRNFFCSDCDIQESQFEKIYQKDAYGIWKYLSCSGDCED